MAEDDYTHSYQVNQDNKEYILTTQLINDTLRIECQDNNKPEQPVFAQLFTLNNFKDIDYYFQSFNFINQVQDEFNKTIEQQTVSIFSDNENSINISFLLKNDINTANITLQLPREYAEQPQVQQPKKKEEPHNYEFQGRCSCPLDNERIDKLEADSGKLQSDHEFLRNEINQILEKINGLKTRINILKEDNLKLNQKTMALREENNSRRVEANRLRENNEAIKRQNHQLREKKNRLEFLLKEHHDPYGNHSSAKTNQTPFETKPLQMENNNNQLGQRTGGATMMPSIAPVGVGANNQNILNNAQPTIINNTYENLPINTDFTFSKGTIIRDKNELQMIVNEINKYNQSIKIDLIYKASTDTDRAEAFHYNCDNAQSTIVLVETTNGRRLGGYTSQSWDGDCVDKKDNNAFVFSLDKMQIYHVIPEKEAIGCYPNFGPVFLGCQIRIYDNAFIKGGSTFERGVTYLTNEDYELTGGEKQFQIKEIEVYEVKFE